MGMTDRVRVVVLGGSALATPLLLTALAEGSPERGYEVTLVGRDRERLDLVTRIADDLLGRFPACDLRLRATMDVDVAFEGADYVINQIRVGGLAGRAHDESFPRRFGIPGEETVGPGGFSSALRGIPVTLELCRRLESRSPNAVVLNLTNPSSLVQYAIRTYTGLRVVGTCDAPVSLMKMIASLLDVPRHELVFEISGMHHFTWVVGVRQAGRERLGEVMGRLDELPKLGVDPEAIRALGAIPSSYLRYYLHPDRVLAMTEGRALRAHQLMALQEDMLAEFRRWQPGTRPASLDRRGAIWYAEIVAPTLLALAEARDTELVLSVDNDGALPWLPGEAIIEVPVAIAGGRLGPPRPASLPQDVRAMVARNCSYEMLAAEAIVEGDRPKALRALLSNLLVRDFNQARGILDMAWPPPEQTENSTKRQHAGSEDALKVPDLFYGEHLLEDMEIPEQDFAVVTMEEPWALAKDRLPRQPRELILVRELDWYRLEAIERSIGDVSAVVGLGGGTPTDAAKYFAWRRHLPVDVIPSITSVDAAVTKSIAARSGGHVTYIGHIVPRHVFVDFSLIQAAPARLNRSGVGDILCAHVALWDWQLARDRQGEAHEPTTAEAMQAWLDRVYEQAHGIRDVTADGIRLIMEAFEDISLLCRRFGSSRPQEGSDHTFAYNAEFQTRKHFLHGELVALGSYVMACLQDNRPEWLRDAYRRTGLLWEPRDIGLSREDFVHTLGTLSWYQNNFGRRYSVLDERELTPELIERLQSELAF
jgi:6-phospho-beta-glucosidase